MFINHLKHFATHKLLFVELENMLNKYFKNRYVSHKLSLVELEIMFNK